MFAFRALLTLVLLLPQQIEAQSATAYKTGERRTGTTKQCFYSHVGREYTKTVENYQLCPLTIEVRSDNPSSPSRSPAPTPAPRYITAFKSGEERTGQTKQCFYSGLGKRYTRTVESYQLCPLSIKVPQP